MKGSPRADDQSLHVKANSVCPATINEIEVPFLRMIESTDTIKHLTQENRPELIEDPVCPPQTKKSHGEI